MTQRFSSQTLPSARSNGVIVEKSPASEVCVCADITNIIGNKPDAGTLQFHMDRFVKHGECSCPEEFLEEVHPYGCPNLTIISCPICKKEHMRFYS